jgi:hypothetical protein
VDHVKECPGFLPHKHLDRLCKQLQVKYSKVKLSFGYIGNCSMPAMSKTNPHAFDDRSWRFFTQVTKPREAQYPGVDYRFSYGNYSTENLDKFWAVAKDDLEDWLKLNVLPHVR